MEYGLLVIVGLLAGLLGGLLGIGGSVVMIPAMMMIFSTVAPRAESVHQYQAAAMIVNFLLIGPAVIRHARAKAIVWGSGDGWAQRRWPGSPRAWESAGSSSSSARTNGL